MNDEDFMNIVDNVFEEMDADDIIEEMGDKSDEDRCHSNDSDCISNCSEDFTKIDEKIIDNSQISASNESTKQCAIYFYYSVSNAVCASCMIDLRGVHIQLLSAIRKHVNDYHDAINSGYCSNCRNPLFMIFSCNMCPICTQ